MTLDNLGEYARQHNANYQQDYTFWSTKADVKDNFGHAVMTKCDNCKTRPCGLAGKPLLSGMMSTEQRASLGALTEADKWDKYDKHKLYEYRVSLYLLSTVR